MTLDTLKSVEITETLENYLEKVRPEPEIRQELDIGYEIVGQSIILNEIRPFWMDPDKIISAPYAKATYVKSKDRWKVYWMRGNLKWYPYLPKPEVKTLRAFLTLVEEDELGCFKG